MSKFLVFFFCTAVFLPSLNYAAKLDEVRETVKAEKEIRDEFDGPKDLNSKESSAMMSGIFHFFVEAFGYSILRNTICAPWAWPQEISGDRLGRGLSYPPYPAQGSWYGMTRYDDRANAGKAWTGRFDLSAGRWDEVTRASAGLDMYFSRHGFELFWVKALEKQGEGYDQLMYGRTNYVFRFARSDRGHFFTGLGLSSFVDGDEYEPGINFVYGFDLLMFQGLFLSAHGDVGTMENAGFASGRVTLGWVFKHFELYGGWDGIQFENGDYTAHLSSPVVGTRLWF